MKEHEIFKYLLILLQCKDLTKTQSLAGKLRAVENTPDAYPGLPLKPEFEKGGPPFLREFFDETNTLDLEFLEHQVRETADVKYGMYRAAVNASRRHHHEYEAQKMIVLEKVEKKKADIMKKEENIKKLMIRKDTLLLSQGYRTQPFPPAVKVKNRVQKGTVVTGQKARLAVAQDIFGVKFTEIQKSPEEDPFITIEGFYE